MFSNAPRLIFPLPQGEVLSGVTTWTWRISAALVERGWDVAVVTHRPPDGARLLPLPWRQGVHVVRTDLPALHDDASNMLTVALHYAEALNEVRSTAPSILFSGLNDLSYAACLGLWRLRKPDIRLVGWCHNDSPYDYATAAYYAPAVDLLGAPSRRIADRLADRLGPELAERILCLPHAVECPDAPPQHAPLKDRPLRILYAGRLENEQKRIGDVPAIVHRLAALGVPCELRIIGDGAERARIESQIESLNRRGVRAQRLDPVAPDRLDEHYAWADVFLLTSQYEALCLAMYEAMAHGAIPVVSRASGIEDALTDGHDSRLFAIGNLEQAADRLRSLAAAPQQLVDDLRHAAWSCVRNHHSMANYADELSARLTRLLSAPSPAEWDETRPVLMPPGGLADPAPFRTACDRFAELWDSLGNTRVALWGAGRHTRALADAVGLGDSRHTGRAAGAQLVCLIDDDPRRWGTTCLGLPIASPQEALRRHGVEVVIISSAFHEPTLLSRIADVAPAQVFGLYDRPMRSCA